MGEVAERAAAVAAALDALGARRGDVVLTLLGNRPEWVLAIVACLRQGFVALPCTEQLRANDLRLRLEVARPALVVADERNADVLAGAGWTGPTLWCPFEDLPARGAPAPAELAPADACLITFTSGTAGAPKAVLHGQRYLGGQRLQAERWLDARPGRAGLVHGRLRLVQVGPQRVHRAVAARRGGAAARRALRPARAAGAARARACRRPLHGADRVPRDRQARRAARRARPARPRGRRRGARSRRARRLARPRRGSGSATATARPRPASSPACRSACAPARARWAGRCRASGSTSSRVSSSWIRPPTRRSSCAISARSRPRVRGAPATACTPTGRASSTSRAAPTT